MALTGIIDSPMFEDLVKKSFYRILMLNLRNYLQSPSNQLVPIFSNKMKQVDQMKAMQYEEMAWVNYLNFDMGGNEFVPLSTFVQ